jgi:ketosteroid isomerase-like protein
MKIKHPIIWEVLIVIIILSSCESQKPGQEELINDPYFSSQDEIREVIHSIVKDAEEANIEGLQSAHLKSAKFTKFGPRNFNRQDVRGTNDSEEAFFTSISNYKQEVRDLKIDVFDDIAIATYYPHVSFIQDGEEKTGSGRQTFVFLSTEEGWKLVHEHGTPQLY